MSLAKSLLALCLWALILQGCASMPLESAADRHARLEAALSEIHLTRHMHDLEARIIDKVEASPIDLGSLSSALVELDEKSLVAHYGLSVFYDTLGETASARVHTERAKAIAAEMVKIGSQRVVGSPAQAIAYLETLGYRCIGASYVLQPESPLGYRVIAVDHEGVNESFDFALSHPEFLSPQIIQPESLSLQIIEIDFNRFEDVSVLMKQRALMGDTAALSLIAALYAQYVDDGIKLAKWFDHFGHGRPNVTINLMRGVVQQNLAFERSGEERMQAIKEAERHYLRAVRVGSTEAMRLLGRLYSSPELGPQHEVDAIKLYRDAARAKHLGATRDLAGFHEWGDALFAQDLDQARRHYRNAFLWGTGRDLRRYTEFLRRNEGAVAFDEQILEALKQGAAEEDASSLLTLGNLYADGVGVTTNYRRARNLLREAARSAPEVPSLINEVAWILSTSNRRNLRDHRFARKIMDHMMSGNEEARKDPRYLDTWAATYAAIGDFDQAVKLQHEALKAADGFSLREDDVAQLETHLESFNQGEALSLDNFDEHDPSSEDES